MQGINVFFKDIVFHPLFI